MRLLCVVDFELVVSVHLVRSYCISTNAVFLMASVSSHGESCMDNIMHDQK